MSSGSLGAKGEPKLREIDLTNLIRSTATVGANTLVSRVFGFVRDLVVARVFGADAGTDAFFVAFKIPNFLRRLFAEGTFAMAFVPVLSDYKANRSPAEIKRFVDDVAGTLGAVLLGVTAIGVLSAPVLIVVFAPGFVGEMDQQALSAEMLRLTFPYLLFISLTAFAGGILNSFHRFAVPAFTPVLLNLSLIGCALWLAPHLERPIVALAWGVLIGGVVQLAFQLPFLKRLALIPRPRLAPRDPGVRRIVGLMVPALFGASVTQIGMLLDTLFASFLAAGSISWLYYSNRLMEFPLGILGAALGTVILPSLSLKHAQRSAEAFSHTLDWALRWVVLLGLPAAIGLLVLAQPLLVTLFHYGAFTAVDVEMAARSLMAYALGLVAFMVVKVLAPGYYARQDVKTPVKFAVVALCVNLGLNLVLMIPLAHAGLALASTLSAALNAGLLLRGLLRTGVYVPSPGWRLFLLRGVLSSALMGAVLLWLSGDPAAWLILSSGERMRGLGLCLAAGVCAYLAALPALGIRLRHFQSNG